MPGPTPKPKRIKEVLGNPGHQKLTAGAQPVGLRGLPECPEHLTGAAQRAWEFLSGKLREMGIDFQVDSLALEGTCIAYGRAFNSDAVINREGSTFTTPNGYVQQRPEVSIAERNWKLFRSFCAEFGLTPAGRTRLCIVIPEKRSNPFANLGGRVITGDEEIDEILNRPRAPKERAN